jgi:hypothetical protein
MFDKEDDRNFEKKGNKRVVKERGGAKNHLQEHWEEIEEEEDIEAELKSLILEDFE